MGDISDEWLLLRKSTIHWVPFSLTFAKSFARDCNNHITITSVLFQFTSATVSFTITPTNEDNGWRAGFSAQALGWTIRYNTPGVWRTTLASARCCGTVWKEERQWKETKNRKTRNWYSGKAANYVYEPYSKSKKTDRKVPLLASAN